MKKENEKKSSGENFDVQFKNIIKNIITEEKYFKEENIKNLTKDILKEIDLLIAEHVKHHFREISYFILNQIEPKVKRIE